MWELTRRSITLATPPFSMMEGKRRGRVAHDNGLYLSRDDLLGFEKYAVINTHSDTYRGEEAGRMGRSWGGRKKKRRREDVSYMCSCLCFIFFFFFFFFSPFFLVQYHGVDTSPISIYVMKPFWNFIVNVSG